VVRMSRRMLDAREVVVTMFVVNIFDDVLVVVLDDNVFIVTMFLSLMICC
jgi:hypothetical protein